jgi:stage II sporulation protein GA (sporulation sigma-E factor processing peptidase)
MHPEVYIDVVFVTNLLMDYMLLRLVGLLAGCRGSRMRCLFAAAAGALFSCMLLWLPADCGSWLRILLHGSCAAGMVWFGCAIKKGSQLFGTILTMYIAAFLCGGFWEVLLAGRRLTVAVFFVSALVTWLGLTAAISLSDSIRARRKHIYPITLSYQGKVQSAYGFYDTGNLLSDPVSGEPVSIAGAQVLKTMLPEELLDKLEHLKENPGELKSTELAGLKPHYLPFKTVGQKEGLMLAITLEDLCIHTPREVVHIEKPVFALSFEPSTLGKEYKVLLNSRLLH